ncbi:hypothetical protein [Armatimonas rosea]|uniref:Uncharacterized protein n=1 Tax=Armatimonas rosea TaxID=685828 RepID=A0A7W9SKH3_ARMRO|nr:hypothetical protein [Armatimonas rosea]MBB6048296.1 hypothetical protein [Armatimonas rosea]
MTLTTTSLDTPHADVSALNTLSLRERLAWLRALDAQTPCGSLLVLSVIELHQPVEGLYSLTPQELRAYFASGYELTLLSSEPCPHGIEHRFFLVKQNSLSPIMITEALRRLFPSTPSGT